MKTKKRKILLFIPTLNAGGAERVMLFIAKNLNREAFDVKLIVIGSIKETLFDTSDVEVIYLNKKKVKSALFRFFKLFLTEKPDIVFGSLTHVNYNIALVSYLFPSTVCIARETFVLSAGKRFNNWDKKLFHRINSIVSDFAHKRINYFICQSEDMKNDLKSNFKYKDRNLITINNPVSNEFQIKTAIPNNSIAQFVTVGRLVKQKGHERILECLANLDTPFRYTIIGEGIEKDNIMEFAKSHNLMDKIDQVPRTNEVQKYLANSHIYLQGSFVEGFPNALIESLAIGTPAVVFDAPGGMNEIIVDGENGFLAFDQDDFQDKISFILNHIQSFGPESVAQHVRKSYGAENIINQYESLFKKVTS
ncbi:glycosyltransferase [Allomuricauda sp. NBRC 101325]|uniref:glycosyltransferase n=1 Tax=Allomuricauda sp. NBRC 101325 TaxID=1113758 RepID=UPI0024A56C8F|nr:glycosyltransferase [Muricauda sp. NBRC 101325]GLU44892.1 N-acetylgalactosamine-N,N'-diacetylbacillosaminyl-diphospho-undecaprenol 4-alpha-N-acetylgalactosaminyltransferase [Muricauda sp. NBRC 101325]